jgi:hypothetical protein
MGCPTKGLPNFFCNGIDPNRVGSVVWKGGLTTLQIKKVTVKSLKWNLPVS